MIKKYSVVVIFLLCFYISACVSNKDIKQPKDLKVEQKSKLENWDIRVTTRLDHNRWVYDTSIKYLGDNPIELMVRTYDNTKIKYEGVKPLVPLETFGSYDYEPSVYSEKNNTLSFTLNWREGDKDYTGVAQFNVKPSK